MFDAGALTLIDRVMHGAGRGCAGDACVTKALCMCCRQIRVPGFLAADVLKSSKKRRTEPGSDAAVLAAVRAANVSQPEKKTEPPKKAS